LFSGARAVTPFACAIIGACALIAACSSGPTQATQPTAKKAVSKGVDPCIGSPPPWREYEGLLKGVRCEQEQFTRMATIATELGVECGFCHVAKPGEENKFDYPPMTEKKELALWMGHTFMSALEQTDGDMMLTGIEHKDGSPMRCKSCHVDKNGKPAAKFLGSPRDIPYSVDWMTRVMTNRFQLKGGGKLKCKTCHVGTWGKDDFVATVLLKTDQVPHGPIPSAAAAPSAAPSDAPPTPSAAPSVAPSGSASASPSPVKP
jgi:hypothetical protein